MGSDGQILPIVLKNHKNCQTMLNKYVHLKQAAGWITARTLSAQDWTENQELTRKTGYKSDWHKMVGVAVKQLDE